MSSAGTNSYLECLSACVSSQRPTEGRRLEYRADATLATSRSRSREPRTSGSVRSCTRGINAYGLPLKLLLPNAPEGCAGPSLPPRQPCGVFRSDVDVSVSRSSWTGALWLLLDCEGFGENKLSGQEAGLYDTKLFAVAVLTCQLFLFNTKEGVTTCTGFCQNSKAIKKNRNLLGIVFCRVETLSADHGQEKMDSTMLDRVATWQQVVNGLKIARDPKPHLAFVLRDFTLCRQERVSRPGLLPTSSKNSLCVLS